MLLRPALRAATLGPFRTGRARRIRRSGAGAALGGDREHDQFLDILEQAALIGRAKRNRLSIRPAARRAAIRWT